MAKIQLTVKTLEFMNALVDEAIITYRDNGCMSAAQICGLYARKHNLTQDDRDYLLHEVEFWAGKKKA